MSASIRSRTSTTRRATGELDPGAAFSTTQITANTVVELGGGSEMILLGVRLATLPSDWIFLGTQSR